MDVNYFGSFDAERNKLHEQILTQCLDKYLLKQNRVKQESKTAIFMSGAFGSGKSHYIKQNNQSFGHFVYIDPDEFRRCLPEFKQLSDEDPWTVGEKTHKEATYLSLLCERMVQKMGLSYICDGSLSNQEWYKDWFDHVKKLGYNIQIIRMECPKEIAWKRCETRAMETGRKIPKQIWEETVDKSKASFEILKKCVDTCVVIDTSV